MKDKVLIVGLGKSGFAAAALLAGEAEVTAWDAKPRDKFDQNKLKALEEKGVKLAFTEYPDIKGFKKAVLSPGVPLDHELVKALSDKGCVISGELEEAYTHCAGTFFAITGTNGKTTTTALAGEIVKAAGRDVRVVGNIGDPVADEVRSAKPETIMVTEVSSFQLETTHTFKPAVSALLNVTPDHLNRHKTFEEYARVKGMIFQNQNPGSSFIYNADDAVCCSLAEKAPCRAVPFSSTKKLSFGAYVTDGGMMVIADGREVHELININELKIPGKHNVENALAAACLCLFGGIPKDAVIKGLRSFNGVEHRIEFIREFNGVRYVNDSKGTNPDASIKAIEATYTPILLIAGGYEKDSDFTELIESFSGRVKYLLLMGFTAKRFGECAVKCGFPSDRIIYCSGMEECIKKGRELSLPGDTVLLSPASASWDMYTCFEERGDHFRRLVHELK